MQKRPTGCYYSRRQCEAKVSICVLLCVCTLICEGGYMQKRPTGCYYSRRQCEVNVDTKQSH